MKNFFTRLASAAARGISKVAEFLVEPFKTPPVVKGNFARNFQSFQKITEEKQ